MKTMWYLLFRHVAIGPILHLLYRPVVVGADQIPPREPIIIAANHCSFVDSLLICLVVPRRVTFVAKREYFDGTGLRGSIRRWFFASTGQIPIDRRGADHADAALKSACDVLDRDGVWAIHPEGTRTSGGVVHRGRTGVMRVAAITGARVVPVGIRGTDRRARQGLLRGWPSRACVVFGRPRPVDEFGQETRCATDRLMAEIAVLAGVAYDDSYAQRPA